MKQYVHNIFFSVKESQRLHVAEEETLWNSPRHSCCGCHFLSAKLQLLNKQLEKKSFAVRTVKGAGFVKSLWEIETRIPYHSCLRFTVVKAFVSSSRHRQSVCPLYKIYSGVKKYSDWAAWLTRELK